MFGVLALSPHADAKRIRGTNGADKLKGTKKKDEIKARGQRHAHRSQGQGQARGRGGDDALKGGKGKDAHDADSLLGTVTGGGGVSLAAGVGVSIEPNGDWTATGLYGCTDDGFLRVTIGGESVDVPITAPRSRCLAHSSRN
jgi:hypothetical protein